MYTYSRQSAPLYPTGVNIYNRMSCWKRMYCWASSLLILSVFLVCPRAQGQGGTCATGAGSSCSVSHIVSTVVPRVAAMTLTGNVTLTPPEGIEGTGRTVVVTNEKAGVLSIRSNQAAYIIGVRSAGAFFIGDGGGVSDKPASDLEVKVGKGAYVRLGAAFTTVFNTTDGVSPMAEPISYRATYHGEDKPSAYRLALIYMLSSP